MTDTSGNCNVGVKLGIELPIMHNTLAGTKLAAMLLQQWWSNG